MLRSDKFLWGIVVGMILVTLSFVIWQLVFPYAGYSTGNGPEDVLSNYIVALHEGDYDEAYGYLSSALPYYPKDVATFRRTVKDEIPDNYDLLVFETEIVSKGKKATVEIVSFSGNWEYSYRYYDDYHFVLTRVSGDWKISGIDGEWDYFYSNINYFNECWVQACD